LNTPIKATRSALPFELALTPQVAAEYLILGQNSPAFDAFDG